MTKKDYTLIAEAFSAAREKCTAMGENDFSTLDEAIFFMAESLAAENPKFDRDRFEEACLK